MDGLGMCVELLDGWPGHVLSCSMHGLDMYAALLDGWAC